MLLKTNRAGELICPAAAHYTQNEFWRKCDSTQLDRNARSGVPHILRWVAANSIRPEAVRVEFVV
jgi:hypothetical protein